MSAEHFLPVADQKNNIIRLSAAQALAGANSVVFYATGAIVGNALAPSSSLATLPITMFVLGMAACILPLGSLARKEGRKAAFMVGTGAGVITGLTAALAVVIGSFLLFCIAAFLGGAYAAVALSFHFAATDAVTLLAQALVAIISAFILKGVKTTEPASAINTGGRPLREIVRQPGLARTVFSGAVTYMVMNFLMTSAPLSMHMHGISQQASNLGIQWHVIAMYGPGFFTGKLINRFGAMRIAAQTVSYTVIRGPLSNVDKSL
ncbi:major facilitator superfamily protein [Klebsiella pneumoniae]|nr:major facilitator superfamily protein [Klebsiella pneumoniae]